MIINILEGGEKRTENKNLSPCSNFFHKILSSAQAAPLANAKCLYKIISTSFL